MVAVVTDTEATMISAGRLIVANSARVGGRTRWHGCVDHSLELVTGIALKDLPVSEGTMSACRTLINFFNSSSQASKAPCKTKCWKGCEAYSGRGNSLVEHLVNVQQTFEAQSLTCIDGR